jgi:hypothetical protein
MSETRKDKTHTPETKIKFSEAKKGQNHRMFNKNHSVETIAKMSAAQGTIIFLYDYNGSLVNTFSSVRKTGEFLIVLLKQLKNILLLINYF